MVCGSGRRLPWPVAAVAPQPSSPPAESGRPARQQGTLDSASELPTGQQAVAMGRPVVCSGCQPLCQAPTAAACLPAWHDPPASMEGRGQPQRCSKSAPCQARHAACSSGSSWLMAQRAARRGRRGSQRGRRARGSPQPPPNPSSQPSRLGQDSGGPAVRRVRQQLQQQWRTSTSQVTLCGPRLACTPGGPRSCSAQRRTSTSSRSMRPPTSSACSMVRAAGLRDPVVVVAGGVLCQSRMY